MKRRLFDKNAGRCRGPANGASQNQKRREKKKGLLFSKEGKTTWASQNQEKRRASFFQNFKIFDCKQMPVPVNLRVSRVRTRAESISMKLGMRAEEFSACFALTELKIER